MDNFLGVCIEYWSKIERESILTVVDMRSVVHQSLL